MQGKRATYCHIKGLYLGWSENVLLKPRSLWDWKGGVFLLMPEEQAASRAVPDKPS